MHKVTKKSQTSNQIPLDLPGLSLLKPKLDTLGTTRILNIWEKELRSRYIVLNQIEEIQNEIQARVPAKDESWTSLHSRNWWLNKSWASLNQCGKNYLANKSTEGKFSYIHSFHCKKKYCPRCSNKKRSILLGKFSTWIESDQGKDIMSKYDMAILTVTLRHNANVRTGWYFKELKDHFYQILKYGFFKKYVKGGFYNTEITYKKTTGYHIHRHAIVLIPKEFNFKNGIVGNWSSDGKRFLWIDRTIPNHLKSQWEKKTKDSHQIDLTPVNDQDLFKNILEIFKYVGKPMVNEDGKKVIPAEVVEQLEKNEKEKFSNRFGILYKVKQLGVNWKDPDLVKEETQISNPVIVSDIYKDGSEIKFKDEIQLPVQGSIKDYLEKLQDSNKAGVQRKLTELQSESFYRSSNFSKNLLLSTPSDEIPLFIPIGFPPSDGNAPDTIVPELFTIF